jgi:antitoxin component YwqK of YwqJK toxin-antitoxin module
MIYKSSFLVTLLISIASYSQDTSYYDNGNISGIGKTINGKPEGLWKYYSKEGVLEVEQHIKNGLRHGNSLYYFPNGQISNDQNYVENKLTGSFKRFYENGFTEMNGKYSNDLKTGEWVYFDNKGRLSIIENYKSGQKHGTQTQYDTNGNKIKQFEFKEGAMISTGYYNDSLWIVDQKLNGKIHGLRTVYRPDGSIYSETNYENNLMHGASTSYYENGKIKAKEFYSKGVKQGEATFYNEDGKEK